MRARDCLCTSGMTLFGAGLESEVSRGCPSLIGGVAFVASKCESYLQHEGYRSTINA